MLDAGGVRCRVLIDGWRAVSPRFVFRGYDDAVHGELIGPHLDADGKLPGRFAALLIEAAGGLVLVDAGLGPFAGDLEAGLLAGELEALGIRPEDVRTVVLTHGHADHAGGLLTHNGTIAFPAARHVVHARELAFWRSPAARELPGEAGEPARVAFAALGDAGLLDPVEDDVMVGDGVRTLDAPGHTPGHLAVVINDELLWAGDAIVAAANVPHPEWVSTADMDPEVNLGTRRALLARAADDRLLLAGAHLPVVGRVKRSDGGYLLDVV